MPRHRKKSFSLTIAVFKKVYEYFFQKKKKNLRLFITKMRNTRSRRAVTCSFLRETGMLRLSGTGFLAHFDGGVNPSKYHSVKKMLCRNSQPVKASVQ